MTYELLARSRHRRTATGGRPPDNFLMIYFFVFSFQIREEHDKALAFIARELALLQATMLKEKRRLESLVNEKTRAAEALSLENERLKKQNKKLQSNVKMLSPDHDMDTPSSEDCSPKSSFSSKAAATKVEVKGRSPWPPS